MHRLHSSYWLPYGTLNGQTKLKLEKDYSSIVKDYKFKVKNSNVFLGNNAVFQQSSAIKGNTARHLRHQGNINEDVSVKNNTHFPN